MKRLFLVILISSALSGCASMQGRKGQSAEDPKPKKQEVKFLQTPNGQLLSVRPGEQYPKVVVTPDGRHAQMMQPTGNLAVVVNPDGTHSTAVINGNLATIVTP